MTSLIVRLSSKCCGVSVQSHRNNFLLPLKCCGVFFAISSKYFHVIFKVLLWNLLCNVIEIFCCYLQCVGVVFFFAISSKHFHVIFKVLLWNN
jgi:hypothetical protein